MLKGIEAIEALTFGNHIGTVSAGQGLARQLREHLAGDALLYQSRPALMYPFFDPRSLDGEISALDVTWQRLSDVHGEPCDLVRVSYADDDEDSLWCFRTDDHLPRRLEWISADGSEDLHIFRLATEPAIDPITADG